MIRWLAQLGLMGEDLAPKYSNKFSPMPTASAFILGPVVVVSLSNDISKHSMAMCVLLCSAAAYAAELPFVYFLHILQA